MITVTKLANRFNISRATILYYEKEGLFNPTSRSASGYRWYGEQEIHRLEQIVAYRSFGLPLQDIKQLINSDGESVHDCLLRKQFSNIETEIQSLRLQQKAIVSFLEASDSTEFNTVNQDRWVAIMRASGMTESDIHNWHITFEKMEPEAHQEFLVSLNMDTDEIQEFRVSAKQ